jgi:hypothetical protein
MEVNPRAISANLSRGEDTIIDVFFNLYWRGCRFQGGEFKNVKL